MALERWSVSRYSLPHLDVQAIRRRDDGLEVDSPRGVFTITCDDPEILDGALLPALHALRDPHSAAWTAVREARAGHALLPMLRELDHAGLIRDSAAADVACVHADIEQALHAWSAALGRELEAAGEGALGLVEGLVERLAARTRRSAILEDSNFSVATLRLQARFLRRDAPAVLALLIDGLRAAVRRARRQARWWRGISSTMPDDWACGLVDPRLVQQYLDASGVIVREAYGAHPGRRVRPASPPSHSQSGINFILDLEAHVAGTLANLGECPAVAAVRDPKLARDVVRRAFLEEYFVTCRYVELISPLLSKRFPAPLRESIHRYVDEERGHEQFERANCLRLGWTDDQIDRAAPLPLYLAYVDILAALTRESPLSFFCMSMFTEGFIGSGHTLVSLALEAIPDDPVLIGAISDHVAVNEESDHRGVGRDWMSRVPLVPPPLAHELTASVDYLAELNWRMWEQLVGAVAHRDGIRALVLPVQTTRTKWEEP